MTMGTFCLSKPVFKEHSASLGAPQPDAFLACSKDCNGPDYAYRIDRFEDNENHADAHRYKLEMGYAVEHTNEGIEIKYYQYMGQTQFDAWTQSQPSNWPNKVVNYLEYDNIRHDTSYYNSQNNLLSSGTTVYAIEKDMGPWEDKSTLWGMPYISSPVFPHANQNNWLWEPVGLGCNEDTRDFEIMDMNHGDQELQDYFDYYDVDQLSCTQVGKNGKFGGGSAPIDTLNQTTTQVINCLYKTISNNGEYSGDHFGLPWNWETLSYFECNDITNGGTTSPFDLIYSVNLQKVNSKKGEKGTTIFPGRLVNSNGVFSGYDYTLDTGLYNITLVFNDLTIVRFLAFNKQQTTQCKKKADVFSAVAYPNPLDKNYGLKMDCDYNLGTIQYDVYTPQEEQIYNCNIEGTFEKGVDKIKSIELESLKSNYPYLVHLFTFSDGSTYSITTLTK